MIFQSLNVKADMLGGGSTFSDKFLGDSIIAIYAANILLNILIFLPPLLILARYDYEVKIKPTWIWAVPLISIIGAYIDILIFRQNILPWMAGLIIIGISFFLVVTLVMEHKFITGLGIAIWAMFLNYMAWNNIDYNDTIHFYGLLLWVFGICYTIALIILFILETNNYFQEDPATRKSRYIRNSICFITTLVLIGIPYIFFNTP